MTATPRNQYADCYDDARRIISCGEAAQIPQAVLAPLCRRVQAVSGVFLRFRKNGDRWQVDSGQTYSLNNDSLLSYAEHYHQQDPIALLSNGLMERPNKKGPMVVRLSELTRSDDFRRSDYYREFLQPHDIGEIIATFVPVRALGNELLSVGLHRPTGAPNFSYDDVMAVEELRPFIASALSNLVLQDAADNGGAALTDMGEGAAATGCAIFDESFKPLYFNPQAQADLLSSPGERQPIIDMLSQAARRLSDSHPGPVSIEHEAAQGVDIAVKRRVLANGAARFIVNTVQNDAAQRLLKRCRTLGFTERECEVVQLIAKGHTNESVSAQLNISVRTVENHLRAMYMKANINSRTQLLAMLFSVG